jgi:hypothetical protein
MPNLERPYDPTDAKWEQTGFSWTFAWFQSDLLQRLAQGEQLIHPQFVEIYGESNPLSPSRVHLAQGFLVQTTALPSVFVFVLHADELRITKNGTPHFLLKTIFVEFHRDGMVYLRTYSKIADQATMDALLHKEDEKDNVVPLRAQSA